MKSGKKRRKGGTKKIGSTEINKCNHFCKNIYPEIYKKNYMKMWSEMPELKNLNKTEKEILENFNALNVSDSCNNIYCSPKCEHIRKGLPIRHVCPACKSQFKKLEKLGAITFCRYDKYIE